jgi:hypothetical protein
MPSPITIARPPANPEAEAEATARTLAPGQLLVFSTGRQAAVFDSLAKAREAVGEFTSGKSSAEWYESGPLVGRVYDHTGKQVARISYNGRAWTPDGERELLGEQASGAAPAPALLTSSPATLPADAKPAAAPKRKRKRKVSDKPFGGMSPTEAGRKGWAARVKKYGRKALVEAGKKGLRKACENLGAAAPATDCAPCAEVVEGPAEGYRGDRCGLLRTPQGSEQACYAVWPLAKLITSHNPETWQADPRYPDLVQERDYSGDPNEQAKVGRIAKGLDPAVMLSNAPTAVDGPAVVTGRGIVLGGNGRTMGLRLAYALGTAGRYVAELEKRAPLFGLSAEQVREVKDPVLVRVVEGLDGASQAKLADASSRYNEGLTGSLDERAKGVAVARRLSRETLEALARLLEEHETLRKAMDAGGVRIVKALEADGIVTPQNRAALVDGAGQLTEAGKMQLEGAFLGLVAGTPERLAQASGATLQRLERLVPYLVQVRAVHPEADAIPAFQGAMDLLREADAAHMTVDQLLSQGSLFAPRPPPAASVAPPAPAAPQVEPGLEGLTLQGDVWRTPSGWGLQFDQALSMWRVIDPQGAITEFAAPTPSQARSELFKAQMLAAEGAAFPVPAPVPPPPLAPALEGLNLRAFKLDRPLTLKRIKAGNVAGFVPDTIVRGIMAALERQGLTPTYQEGHFRISGAKLYGVARIDLFDPKTGEETFASRRKGRGASKLDKRLVVYGRVEEKATPETMLAFRNALAGLRPFARIWEGAMATRASPGAANREAGFRIGFDDAQVTPAFEWAVHQLPDSSFAPAAVDWRPAELIPEDFYAL